MRYYNLIKSLYAEEEWELLLKGELQNDDNNVDISPGSGFHLRIRCGRGFGTNKREKN